VGTTESDPTTAKGTLLCVVSGDLGATDLAHDDFLVLLNSLLVLVLVRRWLKDSNSMVVDISENLRSAE
jgi:hypothetical protein